MVNIGHSHRSTLKQKNKAFKGKSKRNQTEGRVQKVNTLKVGKMKIEMSKMDRKNRSKLIQKQKREENLSLKRIFQGKNGAPKTVSIVPLCPDVSAVEFIKDMTDKGFLKKNQDDVYYRFNIFDTGSYVLDVLKFTSYSDYVIFLLSAVEEVDSNGDLLIKSIKANAIPHAISIVQRLDEVPAKKQQDVKKSLVSFMSYHFVDQNTVYSNSESDLLSVVRILGDTLPKSITWRDSRPFIISESYLYDENTKMLKLTGYNRGVGFSPNRLIHFPGWGSFQIDRIVIESESRKFNDMEEEAKVLNHDPNLRDSLDFENVPDLMQNEQTWPTEEELMEGDQRLAEMQLDENQFGAQKKKLRVPKGTSSYQATWISDDEEESDNENSDEGDDASMMDDQISESSFEEIEDDEDRIDMENEFDDAEENEQYKEYIKKRDEERAELQFPDEKDTPLNQAARIRFQRYRGLASFRTSAWDPYENLPLDYGKIYQFHNIKASSKKAFKEAFEDDSVGMGKRISIFVENVPVEMIKSLNGNCIFAKGLLRHEQKMSVFHFTVTRNAEYTEPIKSKDPLILVTGLYALRVNPIFSQNTNGNLQKFERYLPVGGSYIASCFAPVEYGNGPALLYRELPNGETVLVGHGSVIESNPKRITVKRIILTGHPFKIHKKSAVVRYMFFNPEDVNWFKPIQLVTKLGRRGHIKESLGTHGYMKCTFNNALQGHDTVCLYLYKRVFPKWTTKHLHEK